jgi:hypothetical protein
LTAFIAAGRFRRTTARRFELLVDQVQVEADLAVVAQFDRDLTDLDGHLAGERRIFLSHPLGNSVNVLLRVGHRDGAAGLIDGVFAIGGHHRLQNLIDGFPGVVAGVRGRV